MNRRTLVDQFAASVSTFDAEALDSVPVASNTN